MPSLGQKNRYVLFIVKDHEDKNTQRVSLMEVNGNVVDAIGSLFSLL